MTCASAAVAFLPMGSPYEELTNLFAELSVTEAGEEMVVDHASGLHEGVADCGANETETTLLQIFAHSVGLFCFGWNLFVLLPGICDRLATDKLPNIRIETSKLFLHSQKSARVGNCGVDFQTVANDAGIFQECAHFFGIVTGDFVNNEIIEDFAIAGAFGKDSVPAQAGLRAFEDQKFK